MKRLSNLKSACAALLGLAVGWTAYADSITNNFDSSLDYMSDGVTNSMWDGVYLGSGDIYNGVNGSTSPGYTIEANETANPGFLTIQAGNTYWNGVNDDGFFLYKVVAGDFDVSVENVEPFDNSAYHFSGLMARAYQASGPHWGEPYGGAETWVDMMRFQEFGIDEDIRYALEGADNDGYITVAGGATDTATSRYLRITRIGDVFSFYTKTNSTDDWSLHGSLTLTNVDGVPMQVGIADASFSTATPTSYFTDFELTGTNVVASRALPANPTDLVATPAGKAVTFSWKPGTSSAGSLLVLRQNNTNILTQLPINTYTYAPNTNFGSGDDLGGGIYVVYGGTNTSATITGLGSTNNHYSCAVYSYSGSGTSIAYGANPATVAAEGTGVPVGINLAITPGSIPANGVGISLLTFYDNIGDTNTISNTNAVWSSSDSSVLTVGSDGTVSGVAVGTAKVTVTYANFSATSTITVHSPAFADSFNNSHNYLANRLPGTTWDGLYLSGTDIPNSTYAPPLATPIDVDANVSSNDVLTITCANSAWQGANDNGPFLFKNVPGDFQASVHITDYAITNYQFVGLQARAYNTTDNASPSGAGYTENFIDWLRFDEYSISTSTFNTQDGANAETDESDGETTDYWLLMVRQNSTNFFFFKKANATDPWLAQPSETIVRADLTNGVPLQVGLVQSIFTASAGNVQFDTFALDATNISGGTPPSATTGLSLTMDPSYTSATLTWVPGTNSDGSASTSFVVMHAGGPISAQPYYGILTTADSIFGQGTDLGGGNYVVYRGVGDTVTVTGLKPGVTYYAAVYGYSGSGTTKSFNEAGSSSTNTPPVVVTGITASLASSIPVGGIGLVTATAELQGGGTVDVSSSVAITSDNTNILVSTNNILSGLAVGTTTNTVTIVYGTNTFTATVVAVVRAPTFTDHFGTTHDFIANGITNTSWDGVYAQPGVIPNTTFSSDPAASISDADANSTSNNVLNVTSENVGWEFAQDDGFFLFKNVTNDFQASVHVTYLNSSHLYDGGDMVGYNNPGLLARAFNTNGSPYNINTLDRGETWVSFTRFDLYGIGTYARYTLNNATTRNSQSGGFNGAGTTSDTNLWLLIVRQNLTNFLFFQRRLATDPWAPIPDGTTYSLAAFAGLPLQVGLLAGGFDSGAAVTSGFDSFTLDETTPTVAPKLSVSASAGNLTITWPASSAYTLQYTASLSAANWQPVTVTPVTANGTSTVTIPATNAAAFFRLAQ
jgi:regulation of enolase protein 1 (concanavalin A-like superfamily)